MCRQVKLHLLVRIVLSAVCLLTWAPLAFPYRPFDLTDADVVDEGEFELELGPVGYVREGSDRFLIAPAVIGNLGIAAGREIVLEGKLRTPVDHTPGSQTSLEDAALSLKQVHRRSWRHRRDCFAHPGKASATALSAAILFRPAAIDTDQLLDRPVLQSL